MINLEMDDFVIKKYLYKSHNQPTAVYIKNSNYK